MNKRIQKRFRRENRPSKGVATEAARQAYNDRVRQARQNNRRLGRRLRAVTGVGAAEEETMKFNLNDKIRVKVTPKGMQIIREQRRYLAGEHPSVNWSKYHEPDADGYLYEQAWVLMNLFGPHFGNGFDIPIETEIEICR